VKAQLLITQQRAGVAAVERHQLVNRYRHATMPGYYFHGGHTERQYLATGCHFRDGGSGHSVATASKSGVLPERVKVSHTYSFVIA
jgi:hypothetical protein